MSKNNPLFHFTYLIIPDEVAWCLAVTLIARADLSKPSVYKVELDEIFDMYKEVMHPKFTTEAIISAAEFKFIAYEDCGPPAPPHELSLTPRGEFKITHLFASLNFENKLPGTIKVAFHSTALPFLRKLQIGIHQLYRQNDLTPVSLIEHMQISNPFINLQMAIVPFYAASMRSTFYCLDGMPQRLKPEHRSPYIDKIINNAGF